MVARKIGDLTAIVRFIEMAERTGIEPATSCVTGRHSNQLNYRSAKIKLGDDLLSHNRSLHYHRRYYISLLCSEWVQVGL